MGTQRYGRPRLITIDDKHYRAHVERFVLQRQNQRAMRPPRQRDIFGGQAEAALRDWLAARLLLAETRILEYEERRGRRANTKYRELDALVIEGRRTAHVFEMKASRTAGSLRRAVEQLRETRTILQLIYTQVATTVLLVDTGMPTADEIAALMAGPEAPQTAPQTLDELLQEMPHVCTITSFEHLQANNATTNLLQFSVDDIIALVGAENLALDWDAEDAEETFTPLPVAPSRAFSTDEDEADPQADTDADNPLAAALRRAGLKDTNE